MACDGLVPVTLGVSSVFTSSWSIHVCLGSFFCSVWSWDGFPHHPECGPWPPPSPALWAPSWLVWSQGLVLGWWVYARCGRRYASMCMQVCLPTQELSPPCLASKRWDTNGLPAGPRKSPVSDYPYLIHCALGHFFPCRRGLVAFGRLPWRRRTLDYGKCFNHVCHYLCLFGIDDQKLLLVIIDEYSQDIFPELCNNYFLLGRWQIVVLAKSLWNKGMFSI